MAKTKQQLLVDNQTSFPNNNTNYITPAILRAFNVDMIQSMVDEIPFGEYTQSVAVSIEALNDFTASAAGLSTGSLLVTASANLNTITFTKGDSSTFNITVNTGSGADISALNQATASLQAFTASASTQLTNLESSQSIDNTKWNTLGTQSGSWVTESETASFARTNVNNTFTGLQTFDNVVVTGTASVALLNVTIESSSVIYSSGSNQFGDAASDVQTLYGSTRIVNELTASGLNYPSADNGAESFIQTDGNGNLSLQYVKTMYQNIRNMESVTISKGTPLYVSGSTGDNANVYIADAGNPLRMPATLIAGDSTLAPAATGKGIIFGHIDGVDTSAYTPGTEVYVGVGGGWTSTRPTGSTTPIQPLGVVTRQGINGMGIVMTETPYDLPNIQTGYVWVGNGSNQPVAISTGSFVKEDETGSFAQLGANQIFTGNNTFVGNTVVSQSAHFGTASFFAPMVISNGIVGDVDLTGSLVANKVGAFDFDSIFLGSQLGGTTANGTFFGYGSTSYTSTLGAYAGGFDNELQTYIDNTGIYLKDFNGGGYDTFLKLLPNSGTNPKPIFTRGLEVTGSTEVGTFTASLANGYVWVGNAANKTTLVATSSFATTGSNVFQGSQQIYGNVTISGSVTLETSGGDGFAFSGKALFLTNSVQTGITIESPIHFYQVGKGDMYIQNNVSGVGSGSMNIIAANGANLNISASNLVSTAAKTTINTGDLQVGKDPTADIYNGFKVDRNGADLNNYAIYNLATSSAILDLGAVDGTGFSYSTELYVEATPSSVKFKDFSIGDYAYHDWLTIPQNTGSNPKPIFNRGIEITGSAQGNVVSASITSNTASIDFSLGNYFEVTSSVTPLHLNVTNIKPGTTSTLIISASASSSILFSPNVAQPSGSAYSGSAGSIDILSLVAFNTSKVNVVSTKALV